MRPLQILVTGALALSTCTALAGQRTPDSASAAGKDRRPQVTGDWLGTWGIYAPPAASTPGEPPRNAGQQYPPMRLDCTVTALPRGRWQATFQGEAGGPYKYTIRMLGRQAGDVVLFKGTADLGPKDGGVYDWIGRATEKEFLGFYTSQGYTGTFRLERPK